MEPPSFEGVFYFEGLLPEAEPSLDVVDAGVLVESLEGESLEEESLEGEPSVALPPEEPGSFEPDFA